MIGRAIGQGFAAARDGIARVLVRLGVTPNGLTYAGLVVTIGAAACYALGAHGRFAWSLAPGAERNAYLLLAFVLLVAASACDMLDGAVARLGAKATPFGAFLDSTLDRFSDFAVYAGIALYYARAGNCTFALLCMLAFLHAFLISYCRARAEDLIESCRVGYWQRGERSAAILIATGAHNIPALVVQQAMLPLFTVLRRIVHTKAVLEGKTPITDPRQGGLWVKVRLWRWPRASWPYDLVTAANIAWLLFARVPLADPLRRWLG